MSFTRLTVTESDELTKTLRPTSCKWSYRSITIVCYALLYSSYAVNLEELIEQRKKERRERLRNRFLSLQNQQKRTNSRYIITVLRPPSNQISEPSVAAGEEEHAEDEPTSIKKQEKTD